MRRGLMLVALAACSKSAPASTEVTGTFEVKGASATVTGCRPDHDIDGTYVVLETTAGALRFTNKQLWWNGDDPKGFAKGAVLDCTRLDRSWGGGLRQDGTSYWRGTLSFDCHDGPHTFTGNLTIDCGNITAEERASLDKQRTDLRDQQKTGAGSATP
ncbi:hypothetical protein BH11MYX3_BH11MYX3_43520 [soil metagenome]